MVACQRSEMSHLELSNGPVLHREKLSDVDYMAWGTMTGHQSTVKWDQSDQPLQSRECWSWGGNNEKSTWKNTRAQWETKPLILSGHSLKVHSLVCLLWNPHIASAHNSGLQRDVQKRLQVFHTPPIEKWGLRALILSLDGLMQPRCYFSQENAVKVMPYNCWS